jgi:hypothetical protein
MIHAGQIDLGPFDKRSGFGERCSRISSANGHCSLFAHALRGAVVCPVPGLAAASPGTIQSPDSLALTCESSGIALPR